MGSQFYDEIATDPLLGSKSRRWLTTSYLVARYEVDDLSKDIFADVHNLAVLAAKLLNQFQIKKQRTLVND